MLTMTNGFQVQLNVSGKKCNLSIICLILYNCVKFQQCISIYEEDINNSNKYIFSEKLLSLLINTVYIYLAFKELRGQGNNMSPTPA